MRKNLHGKILKKKKTKKQHLSTVLTSCSIFITVPTSCSIFITIIKNKD